MFELGPEEEVLAHKIRLKPNIAQRIYLAQAAGTARFTYNWGLNEWERQYQLSLTDPEASRPTWMNLNKQLNHIKRDQFPWMMKVTKCAPERALMDLGSGYENFLSGRAARPHYHKRGYNDSFYLHHNAIKILGKKLWIPKLGWVRMYEPLRFQGEITSATISRKADQWFVSIAVQMPKPEVKPRDFSAVGVDLGCTTMATLSTGEKLAGPKPHKRLLSRQRRLQRSLSRKQKGSHGREKAKQKLAKLHLRIANIRKDYTHKLTTRLVNEFTVIGIENLNVSGMSKNHALARSILDQNFSEFRRQLEYKAKRTGTTIAVADRWYPSSKTCSRCKVVKEKLSLGERMFHCESCDLYIDRDLNAAINLEHLAVWSTVAAWRRGELWSQFSVVKLPSLKQEVKFSSLD